MGCDACYTNHAEANSDDMDTLMLLLAAGGCAFLITVPGADDIMLNYQSLSLHDALFLRRPWGCDRAGIRGLAGADAAFDAARPHRRCFPQRIWTVGEIRMSDKIVGLDPYAALRAATPARIGLGRSGNSLPTRALLDFQLAHARARDAVHGALDVAALAQALVPLPAVCVQSRSRTPRPICVGPISGGGSMRLAAKIDGDGRKTRRGLRHRRRTVRQRGPDPGGGLIAASLPGLAGLKIAPVVIARFGRVALGDEIAEILGGKLCVLLVGERPGLSVADSLGVY